MERMDEKRREGKREDRNKCKCTSRDKCQLERMDSVVSYNVQWMGVVHKAHTTL